MLPKLTEHFVQGLHNKRGGSQKDPICFGEHDELLTLVKEQKLRWFGEVSMSSG